MMFRTLNADEIECRVQTVTQNGCSVLLYKDARCDMNILDETVGPERWQRAHEIINGNLYCNVGIWTPRENGYGEWVWKQDVGTESNTEKEKGQASDSFKRACTNWGIGRELYTAPFIWIDGSLIDWKDGSNGKKIPKNTFSVDYIDYDDKRRISALAIAKNGGKIVWSYGQKGAAEPEPVCCPLCGKPVPPVKGKDGVVKTPLEVLRSLAMCPACYKKHDSKNQ